MKGNSTPDFHKNMPRNKKVEQIPKTHTQPGSFCNFFFHKHQLFFAH